jgi:hypothetical protein
MSESELQIGEEPDYEEKLDEAPKSILLGMMKQLKPGMDLSRVTLPTFILEPRSFLEKFSDFMAHSSILVGYVVPSLILGDFISHAAFLPLAAAASATHRHRMGPSGVCWNRARPPILWGLISCRLQDGSDH